MKKLLKPVVNGSWVAQVSNLLGRRLAVGGPSPSGGRSQVANSPRSGLPVFTISLCLNLALASAAVWLLRQAPLPLPGAASTSVVETPTAALTMSPPVTSSSAAAVTFVTNHFAWSKIEAEDFAQLAANLRAIGCPEKTIRDIVIARGRRAFEKLSKEAEPKLPFWTAGLRRARASAAAEGKARLALEKLLARVERVVGPDVFLGDSDLMKLDELEGQALMRFLIGPMPEETFSKVTTKLAWFGARHEELRSRTRGVWLETDEAALAQLREQYHRELAALLAPMQLEEMTARMGMPSQMDRVKFEATDLTTADVRQLALIRARFTEQMSERHSFLDSDSLTDEQELALKAAERQFLGEVRFAQLERAADGDFKTLFSLSQEHHLPRAAAEKVFDLRQLTTQESEQLRQDKSLSEADRKQRVTQMQAEMQSAVLQVLGANASGQYLGSGGAWLTNVTGL